MKKVFAGFLALTFAFANSAFAIDYGTTMKVGSTLTAGTYYTAASLNLRSEASMTTSAGVDTRIGGLKRGETVTVESQTVDKFWCKLSAPRTGWVACKFLTTDPSFKMMNLGSTMTPAVEYKDWVGKMATVKAGVSVNVRKGPGVGHTVMMIAKAGDTYKVLSVEGIWLKLDLGDGKVGYSSGRYWMAQ